MKKLFDHIANENKAILLKQLECLNFTFKKGSPILTRININNILGIISNGSLQITKTDYNGNITIIEELEENDIFGSAYSSITNDEYDIYAKTDTTILLIDYTHIINSKINSETYNQFLKNLLEITNDKITERNERIEILAEKTIRNKLLAYFNTISRKQASKIINIPFTLSELADYLSINRSAMMRELKYLKEEKLIETKTKRIYLNY